MYTAVRQSLREPIPELELAAKLLDAAVDALISGHTDLARQLVGAANLPEIRKYAVSIVGKMSPEIHRSVKRPTPLPYSERDATRMPPQREQEIVFARDGWRCRFCGVKVISRAARSILTKLFPVEAPWPTAEFERHSALYALASSLDHIQPHGRGGRNEAANFVTACYCCQFGRGEWTLDEVEVDDPTKRAPIIDSWDGLSRIVRWAKCC